MAKFNNFVVKIFFSFLVLVKKNDAANRLERLGAFNMVTLIYPSDFTK